MARRGGQLREHILWVAKGVFLELGFERTSMDVVANRAETSKRTLYAFFESKEKLFLAVIELVRGLFLARIKMPADYGDKPVEALTRFCGRYLEILSYEPTIQMIRISQAESERFPEQSRQYFEVLFEEAQRRISAYLRSSYTMSGRAAADAADQLLARILYPRMLRALFGLDELVKSFDLEHLSPHLDLKPIRKVVMEVLQGAEKH